MAFVRPPKACAAIALAVAMLGAPAHAITPAPPAPPLQTFGVWTIEQKHGARDTLRLVGRDSNGAAVIEIECYGRSKVVGIVVPLGASAKAGASEPVQIQAWNETNQRVAAQLPVADSTTAVALVDTRKAGDGPPGAAAVLAALRRAKAFFAFEVAGATVTLDARRLPAALTQFDKACVKLR